MGNAVCIQDLTYRFSHGAPALEGASLHVKRGSRVAIMGPNGAGKSTLLLHLNGIYLPQAGQVEIDGLPLSRETEQEIRRRLGLVFQDPDDQVFSPTVWEDVLFGPQNLGLPQAEAEERAEQALVAVGMLPYKERSPLHLSFGQRKRVAIAGVLAMRPSILALDEPMAYLDPESQDGLSAILDDLHARGTTLIVATHDVDWAAEWADEVILLCGGRVLRQGPPSILADPELVQAARLRMPRLARLFRQWSGGQGGGRVPCTMAEALTILEGLAGGGADR